MAPRGFAVLTMVQLRRAEPDDQHAIATLIGRQTSALRQRFGRFKVINLIEASFLSVVALDDDGGVVGSACFEDSPNLESSSEKFFDWLDDAGGAEGYASPTRFSSCSSSPARERRAR